MDKRTNMVKTEETKIFWGQNFLITVGKSHYVVQDLFNLTKLNPEEVEEDELPGSSDAILYKVLYRMMKETFLLIERLGSEIDIINRELFTTKSEKIIEQISRFRKNIIHINTIFRPQLRLFHKFESGEVKGFAEDMEDYWGNISTFTKKCGIWLKITVNWLRDFPIHSTLYRRTKRMRLCVCLPSSQPLCCR
jgi:magnesium transporter